MSKKLTALAAALCPPILMLIAGGVAHWAFLRKETAFNLVPSVLWWILAGVFAVLYLLLPLTIYPRKGDSALIGGTVVGILLAIVLVVIGYWGLGIPLPFPVDSPTLLTTGTLCITGNILCIIQTMKQRNIGKTT